MLNPAFCLPECATREQFRRGALLTEAGSSADAIFLIDSGQVRVYRLTAGGREMTTALLGPGQICDIAPLSGRTTYHSFVAALTRTTVWRFPVQNLWEQLQTDPALRELLVRALGQRLALADALLYCIGLLPVADRLAPILRQVERCFDGEHPQLTREGMAQLVGAQRETISRLAHQSPAGSF